MIYYVPVVGFFVAIYEYAAWWSVWHKAHTAFMAGDKSINTWPAYDALSEAFVRVNIAALVTILSCIAAIGALALLRARMVH